MLVHKSRALLAVRLHELNDAKADHVQADDDHADEDAAKTAWTTKIDHEISEAEAMAHEMKTQNIALYAALANSTFQSGGASASVKARIKGVCDRVQHVFEGRHTDLIRFKVMELERRTNLVNELNDAKTTASNAQ